MATIVSDGACTGEFVLAAAAAASNAPSEPHHPRRVLAGHPRAAGASIAPTAEGDDSLSAGTSRTAIARSCGYLYETDYGDVWWVWIVTDRIPIGIGIVFLYFGFRVTRWWIGAIFFGSLASATAADDSAPLRARDRDYVSDSEAMAGSKGYISGDALLMAVTPILGQRSLIEQARTPRINGTADVLTPGHEIEIDVRPPSRLRLPCTAPAQSLLACLVRTQPRRFAIR